MSKEIVRSRKEKGFVSEASYTPTLTLADSGWSPQNYKVEAMFDISRRVTEARKRKIPKAQVEKGLGGYAPLNIGEFVVTTKWLDKQLEAIVKGHREGAPRGITAKVDEHIVKSLRDMSSYGPGKGGEQIRKQILDQFKGAGNPFFVDGELSVVGGGVENSLRLIKYALEKCVPDVDKMANHGLTTLDWREKSAKQLGSLLDDFTNEGHVNLIIENSALLPIDVRQKLQVLLRDRERFVVTDVITETFDGEQPHLALEEIVGDHVITVDGTPLAQASNLSAVFAEEPLTKMIQTIHTRTLGPPPSTQSNLRILLSDSDIRKQLIERSEAETESSMPGRYIEILSRLAMAIENPSDKGAQYLNQARESVGQTLSSLEDKLDVRYKDMFTGAEGTVVMGGGRKGNVESLMFLRNKYKVKKILVTGPGWTYKDMTHMLEDLAQEGISDMEIIIEPNGTNIDGTINTKKMIERMGQLKGGDNFAVFANSGPNNPTGTVPSREDQESLYDAAVNSGVTAIIDDCAYIECADPKDRHTYAEIHKTRTEERRVPVLINMATLSKGITSMPSGRLAYVSSDNQELNTFLRARRDRDQDGLNSLSILLADAILSDQQTINDLEITLREDIRQRLEPTVQYFQDEQIKYLPSDHYYICAEAFHEGEDPREMGELLADYYRAGAIAINLLSGLEKEDGTLQDYQWKNWIRFALGGLLPNGPDEQPDYNVKAKEVAHWFKSLEDLRIIIKKEGSVAAARTRLEKEAQDDVAI